MTYFNKLEAYNIYADRNGSPYIAKRKLPQVKKFDGFTKAQWLKKLSFDDDGAINGIDDKKLSDIRGYYRYSAYNTRLVSGKLANLSIASLTTWLNTGIDLMAAPERYVSDHINHVRKDNRFENLRIVPQFINDTLKFLTGSLTPTFAGKVCNVNVNCYVAVDKVIIPDNPKVVYGLRDKFLYPEDDADIAAWLLLMKNKKGVNQLLALELRDKLRLEYN